jgi:hypothetical protein
MTDARYAYHEAGHAVAAAILEFPFRSSGVHIDSDGVGITFLVRPSRMCSIPFSDLQISQSRMIIVLFAGLLAQKKFRPDSSNNSAADDELKIRQYLGAIYRADKTSELIARNYLKQEAERLVHEFWNAITAVAEALWAKEYSGRTINWGSGSPLEKAVAASEIAEILTERNISFIVDDLAVEEEPTTATD